MPVLQRWSVLVYALIVALAAILFFAQLTQFPRTLWVDEAWFGLKGRAVLSGQNLFPFEVPGSGVGVGNSPFQIYASAAAQSLGVPAAYSSRAASAAAGLLTVVLLYPALLVLFRDLLPPAQRAPAALLGTAALATQFVSLFYSRDGSQNASCLLATLVVAAGTYLAFERRSRGWAIAAGAALGLAQTTYEAALALPILVAVYGLARWQWPGPLSRRAVLRLGAWLAAAALLAALPILILYWRQPELLLTHLGQTQNLAPSGGPAAGAGNALDGLFKVWLGISVRGDMLPGRNVVGRPMLDAFTSVLAWSGLLWAAWRMRQRPAVQLLLIWLIVMSLPAAVTNQAPAFPRMLPMLPALAGLAGLGAALAWQVAAPKRAWDRGLIAGLLGLGLVIGSASSLRAYRVDWAADPRAFDARNFGPRLVADEALARSGAATVLITTRSHKFTFQAFQLLLDGSPVWSFDAGPACLPYAHDAERPAVYGIIQVIDPASLPALQAAYPSGREVAHVMHPDGYAYATFFEVPAHTPAPAPQHPVSVEFAGGLRLVGLDAPAAARPGETFGLCLHWEAAGPLPSGLTGFVHIGQGRESRPLVGQQDAPLCQGVPLGEWRAPFRYIESRSLTLTPDAPAGHYDIRVGVYDPARGLRLTILSADRPVEDDRVQLIDFQVQP